jgi:hypothetical protein
MIGANVSVFSIGKAVGRGGGAGPLILSYAVVAGGGGGGSQSSSGGGGAGGMLEGADIETYEAGVAYQVTIGLYY